MQGRENTSGDLMGLRSVMMLYYYHCRSCSSLSSQRLLYPPGSAYRSETGGLMSALRVLSVEQSESIPLGIHPLLTSF
jgi:hypothetical protein